MKYIRTKNDIYDMSTKNEKGEYDVQIVDYVDEETYGGRTGRLYLIPPKSVIKQADTIEELCDNFVRYVAVDDFHNILRDYEFKDLKLIGERIRKTDDKVYGAIWTDKGLIYVAKMNEKGELELL